MTFYERNKIVILRDQVARIHQMYHCLVVLTVTVVFINLTTVITDFQPITIIIIIIIIIVYFCA